MRYVTGRPRTWEQSERRLRKHMADRERYGFGLCAAILKSSHAFIGRCGLDPTEQNRTLQGDVGWMFMPEFWGQGLATEFGREMIRVGFEELALRRIFATAHRDNAASIRVMEKLSMTYVGSENGRVEFELIRDRYPQAEMFAE